MRKETLKEKEARESINRDLAKLKLKRKERELKDFVEQLNGLDLRERKLKDLIESTKEQINKLKQRGA